MVTPEKNYYIRKYICSNCGTENEMKILISNLLFEGDYSPMPVADRRPGGSTTFTCKWCGRKNNIVDKQ